jgi:hypothetical protein
MGEEVLPVLERELAKYTPDSRGAEELPQESWFRLRNLLLVLGNIRSSRSAAILRLFIHDREDRIVAVTLEALENYGGPQASEMIAEMLSNSNPDIQRKALRSLGQVASDEQWEAIRDYFLRNPLERSSALSVLSDLDKERTISFLADVLEGKTKALGKFFSKPDDYLNEFIVNTFIQWRLKQTDMCLQRYVKGATKSLLDHLRKPTSVKLAEKYLKSRAR